MKTIVKAFLLIFLSVIMFASCTNKDIEIFDENFSYQADKTDLEGVTIKYYRASGGLAFNITGEEILGFEVGTTLGDLAVKRVKDVQNDLNCKLEITHFSDSSATTFRMSNASGTYFCDIFCSGSNDLRSDMKIGALVDMSEIEEYIDYRNEEKWGVRKVLEPLYWEDDLYGLIPMLWPTSSVSYRGPLIINENLIASMDVEDPRDLYENGQWTWATFRDCLEKYYLQEGSDVIHYSLAAIPSDLGSYYLLSNGYRIARKGSDGNYQSGLRDQSSLVAMDEALDILKGSLSYTIDKRSENLAPVEDLINDKAVMGLMHYAEYVAERIVRQMTNFGAISWPTGPNVEPGYLTTFISTLERTVVISRFSPNIEATAMALNALYEPFEEYPDSEAVKDFLNRTFFFDRRDADIYYDMFTNAEYSYFSTAAYNSLGEWTGTGQTPTEYIDSHLQKLEEYISEEIAPSKRGVEHVWGQE